MEDNQKRYLDRVVDLIVRDTIIDYGKEEIHYPFLHPHLFPISLELHFIDPIAFSFTNYCRDTYGLGTDEIEYVWKEYINIFEEKKENGS